MPSSIKFTEIVIKEGIAYAGYGGACVIELKLLDKETIINLITKMKIREEEYEELHMSDMTDKEYTLQLEDKVAELKKQVLNLFNACEGMVKKIGEEYGSK